MTRFYNRVRSYLYYFELLISGRITRLVSLSKDTIFASIAPISALFEFIR